MRFVFRCWRTTGVLARLNFYPELKRRLAGAQASGPVRGAICSASMMRSVVRRGVALIGDAAGTMDALTGQGLSLGVTQALVLAAAPAAGNIQKYENAFRRLTRRPALSGTLMLAIGRRTRLRRHLFDALAAQSSLLNFALSVHIGFRPTSAVPVGPMIRFLGRLVIGGSFCEELPRPT
jgi:flavin-dependent dehydrogenase